MRATCRRFNDGTYRSPRSEKARGHLLHERRRFQDEERLKAQKWEQVRREREKEELNDELRWVVGCACRSSRKHVSAKLVTNFKGCLPCFFEMSEKNSVNAVILLFAVLKNIRKRKNDGRLYASSLTNSRNISARRKTQHLSLVFSETEAWTQTASKLLTAACFTVLACAILDIFVEVSSLASLFFLFLCTF